MTPLNKRVFSFLFLTMLSLSSLASLYASDLSFDHQHAQWTSFLKTYVIMSQDQTASNVQYGHIKVSDLEPYLKTLSSVSASEFDSWTLPQRQSFLINAYNAFTVELIRRHYPVQSIRNIGWSIGSWQVKSPWEKRFFKLFGQKTHLDHIEHDLIRGDVKLRDPRIHFALNCASKGCPALRNEAYIGSQLNRQLDQAIILFLKDSSRNDLKQSENTLQLSPIFKWYKDDFGPEKSTYQGVRDFVASYATQVWDKKAPQWIRDNSHVIQYSEYDWSLNKAE